MIFFFDIFYHMIFHLDLYIFLIIFDYFTACIFNIR